MSSRHHRLKTFAKRTFPRWRLAVGAAPRTGHGTTGPHAALRDLHLGFPREGEMKTLSQGRTARLRAAVDRYEAIDFDDPHQKRVRKTASKCAAARANIAIVRGAPLTCIHKSFSYQPSAPKGVSLLVPHAPPFAWPAPHFYSSPTVQIEPALHENVSAHARAHLRTPNHPHSIPPDWKCISVP
jgi:hypothetical protein